jgi:hypothetical protein
MDELQEACAVLNMKRSLHVAVLAKSTGYVPYASGLSLLTAQMLDERTGQVSLRTMHDSSNK